jgi:hypothetical protein
MNHQQRSLFGQALRVYLNHSLTWVMLKTEQLFDGSERLGEEAVQDGRKLRHYLRNALRTPDSVLCSVRGITVLVVNDRAEQALACSIDSGRKCKGLSLQRERNAASLYRSCAKVAVNMLVAELQGEAELSELWNIACGLLDGLCSKTCADVSSSILASEPVSFLNRGHYQSLTTSLLDGKSSSRTERKLWACDTILSIVGHHGGHLSIDKISLQQTFLAEKMQYCAIAVRDELIAICQNEQDGCAVEAVVSIFRSCVKQLKSLAVHSDIHSQLSKLPSSEQFSTLTSIAPQGCASPLQYVRAQASVAEQLKGVAAIVNSVKKLHGTASTGSAAQLFTRTLSDQYTAILDAVHVSPLFTHPAGDLTEEYRRLLDGMRLIPTGIMQDWAFRQRCSTQVAAAAELREVSAAHALVTECWVQAVTVLDKFLLRDPVHEWDSSSITSMERTTSQWKETAYSFTHIADNLVTEITRLQSTAVNSDKAGRHEAGQLWRDAADIQLQIAQLRFRGEMISGTDGETQSGVSISGLHDMTVFVKKCTHLARALDSSPPPLYMTQQELYVAELRKCSVAHGKTVCLAILNGSSEHMQACCELNAQLESIIDAYLSAAAPTTVSLPPALQIRLAALSSAESSVSQLAESPHPAWVPESLYECSNLLLNITEQADLPASLRVGALQSTEGASEALQFAIDSIASTGRLVSSAVGSALACNTVTAYISAAQAVLAKDLNSWCLFSEGAVLVERALEFYDAKDKINNNMCFVLHVADRVFQQALSLANQTGSAWVQMSSSPYVTQLCTAETCQIVKLLRLKAELYAVRAAVCRVGDKTARDGLLVQLKEIQRLYQSSIEAEYNAAEQRLASRGGLARLQWSSRTGSVHAVSISAVKQRSAEAQETAKCMLDVVLATTDPLTPRALLHCLQQLAHYRKEAEDAARRKGVRRVDAARLADWFGNTVTALKHSGGGAVAAAWQQAAEKGKEVYQGENDGRDKALLNAGVATALCLKDIAVAVAAGQLQQAAQHRPILVHLQLAEQRIKRITAAAVCAQGEAASAR